MCFLDFQGPCLTQYFPNMIGQLTIIPKPEWSLLFRGGCPYYSPPFGVTTGVRWNGRYIFSQKQFHITSDEQKSSYKLNSRNCCVHLVKKVVFCRYPHPEIWGKDPNHALEKKNRQRRRDRLLQQWPRWGADALEKGISGVKYGYFGGYLVLYQILWGVCPIWTKQCSKCQYPKVKT